MAAALELVTLNKSYKGRDGIIHAVRDLTLAVPQGQVLAFLGPNGAGKTTTMKMICGLITPSDGRICINGYDIRRQRPDAMRQIGVVLEGARNVYWRLSAWENILYFGHLKGIGGKMLRERGEHLLQLYGLWERRRDEVGGFSRGMQQKLAIICALIADPPILLLDEPTLGLDVHAAQTIREQIEMLAAAGDKTIIITTHQLELAEVLCSHVAIINQGEMIANQPMAQLLALFEQPHYTITIAGHHPPVADFVARHTSDNERETTYAVETQDEVYTLLDQLNGAQLLRVQRVKPTLQDAFIRLTGK